VHAAFGQGEGALGLKGALKHAALLAAASAEPLSARTARVPLNEYRNFLLLQYPSALGTAVHATPLVRALKEARSNARVALAASGIATEIFANHPGVERMIVTPYPLADLRGAARALRNAKPFAGEPFVAITTAGNERTRIALATLRSGAGARVGFTEAPELYQASLRFDPQRSLIDNNLRILEALGYGFRHYEPEVVFREEDLQWAHNILGELGVRDGQMVVTFVTQTSVTQRKGWRAERFQAAARHMIERYGAHIVFVGTAAESGAIEAIRAGLGDATSSFAGRTTLLQLTALLSLCRVGLTLDTGILHLGRAVGLPMTIIAPAWSPPIEWLPLGNPRYRILKNADMPAALPGYIVDEVSVDEAIAALDDLVAAYPQGGWRRRASALSE
jgi:ADP-heptose:LPS heptosyltransferase